MLVNANAAKSNRASGRGGRCGLEGWSAVGLHGAGDRVAEGGVPAGAVGASREDAWDTSCEDAAGAKGGHISAPRDSPSCVPRTGERAGAVARLGAPAQRLRACIRAGQTACSWAHILVTISSATCAFCTSWSWSARGFDKRSTRGAAPGNSKISSNFMTLPMDSCNNLYAPCNCSWYFWSTRMAGSVTGCRGQGGRG